jgi:ribonuclease E
MSAKATAAAAMEAATAAAMEAATAAAMEAATAVPEVALQAEVPVLVPAVLEVAVAAVPEVALAAVPVPVLVAAVLEVPEVAAVPVAAVLVAVLVLEVAVPEVALQAVAEAPVRAAPGLVARPVQGQAAWAAAQVDQARPAGAMAQRASVPVEAPLEAAPLAATARRVRSVHRTLRVLPVSALPQAVVHPVRRRMARPPERPDRTPALGAGHGAASWRPLR